MVLHSYWFGNLSSSGRWKVNKRVRAWWRPRYPDCGVSRGSPPRSLEDGSVKCPSQILIKEQPGLLCLSFLSSLVVVPSHLFWSCFIHTLSWRFNRLGRRQTKTRWRRHDCQRDCEEKLSLKSLRLLSPYDDVYSHLYLLIYWTNGANALELGN